MARGNQRDLAREKNMKKQQGKKKGAGDNDGNKVSYDILHPLELSVTGVLLSPGKGSDSGAEKGEGRGGHEAEAGAEGGGEGGEGGRGKDGMSRGRGNKQTKKNKNN